VHPRKVGVCGIAYSGFTLGLFWGLLSGEMWVM